MRIHTKYGYETREYVEADARLEKWLKKKKRDELKCRYSTELKHKHKSQTQ